MSQPLFVLSAGRSGSTLLQRLLNSYDHVTLWGEHTGFLAPLADAYFQLLEHPSSQEFIFSATLNNPLETREQLIDRKDPRHWQAWLNFVTPDDVTEFFRNCVESFFRHPVMDEGHIWGFKEIRYGTGDRVIEFLSRLYPEAVFVFLHRNAFNTLISQMRAFNQCSRWLQKLPSRKLIAAARRWRAQYRTLREWHDSGKLHSHWISFEALSTDPASVEQLLEALGLEFGPVQRSVLELEQGRGSAFRHSLDDTEARWKAFGYLPLAITEIIAGDMNERLGHDSPAPVQWIRRLRHLLRLKRRSNKAISFQRQEPQVANSTIDR